jgi:mRNA interferase RelE/StbE
VVWTIKYTEIATKIMLKMDKSISKKIDKYLQEKIATAKDPSVFGKALGHDKTGLWRYRVENYRIICEVRKTEVTVLVLRI